MKYRLSDCVEIISGGTPKKSIKDYWGGNVPWLTIKDFTSKYPKTVSSYITKTGLNNSSAKITKDKDILISARGTVGEIMMVHSGYTFNQSIYGLRVKENLAIPEYIYYWLLANNQMFSQNVHGSVFDTITRKTFDYIQIDLPELSKQAKIVTKLNNIDSKISVNERINDNLLKLAKTKFWQIYLLPTDEFKMVPNGWEIASFSKIMTFSNGHNFKSNEMLKKYEPLTYKVFKQGNILIGGGLNELGTKSWIQKGKVTKLNKYVLKKWDLLMAMTDMKNKVAILGNTALMNCSNQYILNQRVGLIRSNNYNGTSPAYLFLLTNSKPFLHSIRSKAHSGVQVNLSSKEIRDTDVIIAPKNVNDGFNTFVKPIFDRIMVNQLENLTPKFQE